jgi:protein gp37
MNMSAGSEIQWTDCTWNPVAGCTPVSPGCLHCYAATMAHRLDGMGQAKYKGLTVLRNSVRTFNGKITMDDSALTIPLRWKKPRRIFVNSMSDLFHEGVPFEFVDKVFAVMALCPQHTFQVLTKRPERMAEYLNRTNPTRAGAVSATMLTESSRHPIEMRCWPLPNVHLGTSVENQKAADERIPHLLKCPAAVRFLSCEPLLGPVDLSRWIHPGVRAGVDVDIDGGVWPGGREPYVDRPDIHWVIVGGESGPGSRPCNVWWIRNIISQCKAAGWPAS